jgi:hypothetical protein
MATYQKFNCFVEDVAEGKHNLGTGQLKVALTNSAPAAGNTVLANITEISYTNCSSRNITTSSSSQSGGTYSLVVNDLTLTASGGSVGPFQYVVIYNDTATNDELICYADRGSAVTLSDGDTFLIDFGSSLFTLA